MPGLVLFRRRWAIGSDDFVLPSFGELVLRIAWLVALIIIYRYHYDSFDCPHGSALQAFFIGTIVLDSICMVNVLALAVTSMRGTIKNSRPRRHICWFIYLKILLVSMECVWVCLSTYWAFADSYTCDWSVLWTARAVVITSWIVGFIMFFLSLIIFDPLGSIEHRHAVQCHVSSTGEEHISIGNMSAHKVWEARCRLLCCCIACNQDTRQAFTDVAQLVADFFHDIDLVPTDIAAGLILVQKHQVDVDAQLSTIIVDASNEAIQNLNSISDCSIDDGQGPKSWMTLANMAHYMKYAMGSYGWPFYMYEYLATGMCRLCSRCRCCSCIRIGNDVVDDNSCQCHTAAIRKLTGIDEDDLVYVTFHNKYKEIPFYVAVDRDQNAVVVSIRGTLSLQDALTDISAQGTPLDIPGVEDAYCHEAMLDCAKYIHSQLTSLHLLETAFTNLTDGAHLVVTGHSLGAGVAAILATLLHQLYPNLQCYSFSPPGGLMSPNASKFTRDYICSVIVGKDLVPRLGMCTLVDLKVKVLRALCESNKPKYNILASGCLRLLCCSAPVDSDESDRGFFSENPTSRIIDDRVSILEAAGLQDALKLAENQSEAILKTQWPMHPAGQILHIVDIAESRASCRGDPMYSAFWSKPEFFDRIVLSHKMVSDHFPNVVSYALDQLQERDFVPLAHRNARQVLQHI